MRIGNFKISWERLKNGDFLTYERNKLSASFSTKQNIEIALANPVLATLINIRADYLSQFNFFEVNDAGDKVENSEFNRLIENPNPYQSKQDFLKQLEWYILCYGWVYQRPYGASGLGTDYLYNLSTPDITFDNEIKRSLIQKRADVKQLGKISFNYKDFDTNISMEVKDVIQFFDVSNGLCGNPFTSPSRVDSIRKSTENISLALDAQNIMGGQIGREMIFKEKQSNSMDSAMPLANGDKQDMERKFQGYGARKGGNRTVILNKEMGWKSMHIPHQDLGFEETISLNANLMAQALQVPNAVYKAYMQGDTYENQSQGLLGFLQGTMQARANDIANTWSSYFNIKIKASIEHLPIMAKVEDVKIDRVLKISQSFRNLTQGGLTSEQANQYMIDNGLKNIEDEQQ